MDPSGSAFPAAEYASRVARARNALQESGLAGAICVSPETLFYLTGYEGYTYWAEQALVLPADGSPAVLVLRDVDLPLAAETARVDHVTTYRYAAQDPVELIADALAQAGLPGQQLGLEKQTYALPGAYFERLARRVGGSVELQDCGDLLSRLRVAKSPAEGERVREAAAMANAAMQDGIQAVRAGVSEASLASTIEQSLRKAGSEYSAMPTMVASGPRTIALHATPSRRAIEPGEPVVFWYAGVSRRYHVTAYRTVHVGPPSARFEAAYLAAQEALEAAVEHVEVGRPVAGAASAATRVLQRNGHDRFQQARCGYGVGIAYPPVWLEAIDVIEESPDRFEAGMLMCLHVCLSVPEANFGLYVGGDYLLAPGGVQQLDRLGTDLVVV